MPDKHLAAKPALRRVVSSSSGMASCREGRALPAGRARLEALLAPLRSASELPWSARETARWKTIVPQMVDWLPAREREAVLAEFRALMRRLDRDGA